MVLEAGLGLFTCSDLQYRAFFFAQRLIASDRDIGLCHDASKNLCFLRPETMANCSNLGQSPAVLQQEFFTRVLESLMLALVQPLQGSAHHQGFCCWEGSG